MADVSAEASPLLKGRIAGLFYLLTFLTGAAAVPGSKLAVPNDPTATSTNILGHPLLFQSAFVAYVINVAVYVVVTVLFYELFKPVSATLSLLAAFFSLAGCTIQAAASLFFLAPLVVLRSGPALGAMTTPQLQALALLLAKLHAPAYDIGLVLFGFYCFLIGVLILRSTFLPRILGGLMVFAGLGWLTFLWPPLTATITPYNVAPGILGEGLLTLWLLLFGVNGQRWREQAGRGDSTVSPGSDVSPVLPPHMEPR